MTDLTTAGAASTSGPDYPYALRPEQYRAALAADFARLRSLAPDSLYESVPGCEGWHGEDVVRHTAQVYLHKVAAIRAGASEGPPRPWPPEHVGSVDALDLLDDAWAQLQGELDGHDMADPCWTWWPPDQSVGFWLRRMAHETSVHRHDVERAVGRPTPVDARLAVDGIDEVLFLMLDGDWSDALVEEASGRTVVVRSAGHSWSTALEAGTVRVIRQASASPAARVEGEASDVLLWLWGRGPAPVVTGDEAAAAELRARLALSTN